MFGLKNACVLDVDEEYRTMEDYQGRVVRWCPGCGDHGILTATQNSAATNNCRPRRPYSSPVSVARPDFRTT